MTTFKIIYEEAGQRQETNVKHWTKEAARESFEAEHPVAAIIEIYDDED